MLFSFLKYIVPTWYFNLSSERSRCVPYFVDYHTLTDSERSLLDLCGQYSSAEAVTADAAYQAFHKGLIKSTANGIDMEACIDNVADNYIFIKRYFNPVYSVYVLGIRLLSFHNPLKEIRGFVKAWKQQRVALYQSNYPEQHSQEYEQFHSTLLDRQPLVSVIIPTLNRYTYLRDVLQDLEQQDYKNFEVIVCDQSEPVNTSFYDGWKLRLQLICQEEKALWLARNRSIRAAKGDYVLLFDDDSRVEKDWITQHLKCVDYLGCDISSGVSLSVSGAKIPAHYAFFRWSDQVDTGNVLFAKNLMKDTGMFDRQFEGQRAGDGEFGLRAYLCGKTNVSNPYAKRIHLKVPSGGLRQMGSWDSFRPKKFLAPRPVPSVLYSARKYFGPHCSRLLLMHQVPLSLVPYRLKGKRFYVICSLVVSVLLFPIPLIQVCRSWSQATQKLKQGPFIESLE